MNGPDIFKHSRHITTLGVTFVYAVRRFNVASDDFNDVVRLELLTAVARRYDSVVFVNGAAAYVLPIFLN